MSEWWFGELFASRMVVRGGFGVCLQTGLSCVWFVFIMTCRTGVRCPCQCRVASVSFVRVKCGILHFRQSGWLCGKLQNVQHAFVLCAFVIGGTSISRVECVLFCQHFVP